MTWPGSPVRTETSLWVAVGLAAGPAIGLGFARFGYALVLPAMRNDLGWSFATAGAMNTANAIGYLLGALVAATVASRVGAARTFLGGLAVTIVALFVSAVAAQAWLFGALRLLTGVSGALTFVIGAALTARAGAASGGRRAALLLAVYFAGSGAGIVVSGLTVPVALRAAGWPAAWFVFAVLGVAGLATAGPAARSVPDDGSQRDGRGWARWPVRRLFPVVAAYGLFGVGYIAYMTFIVAYLHEQNATGAQITAFWVLLGATAMALGGAWSPVLARLRGGRGVATVLGVVTAGSALPLLGGDVAAYASAVVFGASFLSVVNAVTMCVRRGLPRRYWTAAIGGCTSVFAVGQCVGPVLAGAVSDSAGGVRVGIAVGSVLLAAATLVALVQPHHEVARS